MTAKSLLIACSCAGLALAACSTDKDKDAPLPDRPAADMFNEATAAAKNGEYTKANKLFDEVERQHPYSDYATQAQLRSAESSYEALRYDDAVIALEAFLGEIEKRLARDHAGIIDQHIEVPYGLQRHRCSGGNNTAVGHVDFLGAARSTESGYFFGDRLGGGEIHIPYDDTGGTPGRSTEGHQPTDTTATAGDEDVFSRKRVGLSHDVLLCD